MKKHSSSSAPLIIRIIIILVAVFLTVTIFSGPRKTSSSLGQETPRSVFAKILPAVVEIRSPGNLLGTGILVEGDKVLTSAHIIQGSGPFFAIQNTRQILVSSFVRHPQKDIAILFLADDFVGSRARIIASQAFLRPGDIVFGFGSIDGSILGHQGLISSLSSNIFFGENILTDLLLSDIPLQAGYSGGPLVNTSGEVIGIHTVFQSGVRWGWSTPVDNRTIDAILSQEKIISFSD